MTNTAKIVFIGAGSQSFGLSMFRDILSAEEMRGSTLTLVDTNPDALERMTALAHRLNAHHGGHVRIEHTTERRPALDGADFVINATAIDRNRLWRLDFEIPRKHGIRHTLGENGGPGGLFFTLRTLPLVFDIVRDVEAICPKALFINFSNPESRIILALGKYSPVRAIGQCHGILMAREDVAHILGREPEELDVWGAGLNHFQCLTDIRDPVTGADQYPALRAAEQGFDPGFRPLTRRLFRRDYDGPSVFGVMVSSLSIITDRITRSRLAGEPPDVHIAPRLGHIGLLEFDRADECIREGVEAVERVLPDLHDALAVFSAHKG